MGTTVGGQASGTNRLKGGFQNGSHQHRCQPYRTRSQKLLPPAPHSLGGLPAALCLSRDSLRSLSGSEPIPGSVALRRPSAGGPAGRPGSVVLRRPSAGGTAGRPGSVALRTSSILAKGTKISHAVGQLSPYTTSRERPRHTRKDPTGHS